MSRTSTSTTLCGRRMWRCYFGAALFCVILVMCIVFAWHRITTDNDCVSPVTFLVVTVHHIVCYWCRLRHWRLCDSGWQCIDVTAADSALMSVPGNWSATSADWGTDFSVTAGDSALVSVPVVSVPGNWSVTGADWGTDVSVTAADSALVSVPGNWSATGADWGTDVSVTAADSALLSASLTNLLLVLREALNSPWQWRTLS